MKHDLLHHWRGVFDRGVFAWVFLRIENAEIQCEESVSADFLKETSPARRAA